MRISLLGYGELYHGGNDYAARRQRFKAVINEENKRARLEKAELFTVIILYSYYIVRAREICVEIFFRINGISIRKKFSKFLSIK